MHKEYKSENHTRRGTLEILGVKQKSRCFMHMITNIPPRFDRTVQVRAPYHSKHFSCAWYEDNVTKDVYKIQNGKLLTCAGTKELGTSTLTLSQHTGRTEKIIIAFRTYIVNLDSAENRRK
jgi:hypothetical protein